MNEPVSRHLHSELGLLFEHLKTEWSVDRSNFTSAQWNRVRYYGKIYVIISCFCEVMCTGVERASFLRNIPEVFMLSLTFGVKGYKNALGSNLRQSIELVYKHIYYAYHPVEYSWVCDRDAFKEIGNAYLEGYLEKTSEKRFQSVKTSLEMLSYQYGKLSRYVHTHNPDYFGQTKLKSNPDIDLVLKEMEGGYSVVAKSIILVVIAYFPAVFEATSEPEKRLISELFKSKSDKADLHSLMGDLELI